MEENEMLEQTSETENVDTLTTEENEEGIELTDTSEPTEVEEEKEEVKKSLRELLEEDAEYQKEFTKILQGRLDRAEKKYQKELSKYKDTDAVLRSTLNLKDGDDTNAKVREFYEQEGYKLPEPIKEGLSQREIEILANGEADDIIADGYDAMNEEAERLANIGYENLNAKDKVIFNKLAETLTTEKAKKELKKIGADGDALMNDAKFIQFKSQFNYNTPIENIYSLYLKENKKETVKENPGSMKNSDTTAVKDYYTPEEIGKLSEKDLDDPKIWEAVRKSMTKNGSINYYE